MTVLELFERFWTYFNKITYFDEANNIDHSDLACEICEVPCNSAYCGCRYYDIPKFIKQWLEKEIEE